MSAKELAEEILRMISELYEDEQPAYIVVKEVRARCKEIVRSGG